eukprot:jgi/Chlat1/6841/Chrsp51S06563
MTAAAGRPSGGVQLVSEVTLCRGGDGAGPLLGAAPGAGRAEALVTTQTRAVLTIDASAADAAKARAGSVALGDKYACFATRAVWDPASDSCYAVVCDKGGANVLAAWGREGCANIGEAPTQAALQGKVRALYAVSGSEVAARKGDTAEAMSVDGGETGGAFVVYDDGTVETRVKSGAVASTSHLAHASQDGTDALRLEVEATSGSYEGGASRIAAVFAHSRGRTRRRVLDVLSVNVADLSMQSMMSAELGAPDSDGNARVAALALTAVAAVVSIEECWDDVKFIHAFQPLHSGRIDSITCTRSAAAAVPGSSYVAVAGCASDGHGVSIHFIDTVYGCPRGGVVVGSGETTPSRDIEPGVTDIVSIHACLAVKLRLPSPTLASAFRTLDVASDTLTSALVRPVWTGADAATAWDGQEDTFLLRAGVVWDEERMRELAEKTDRALEDLVSGSYNDKTFGEALMKHLALVATSFKGGDKEQYRFVRRPVSDRLARVVVERCVKDKFWRTLAQFIQWGHVTSTDIYPGLLQALIDAAQLQVLETCLMQLRELSTADLTLLLNTLFATTLPLVHLRALHKQKTAGASRLVDAAADALKAGASLGSKAVQLAIAGAADVENFSPQQALAHALISASRDDTAAMAAMAALPSLAVTGLVQYLCTWLRVYAEEMASVPDPPTAPKFRIPSLMQTRMRQRRSVRALSPPTPTSAPASHSSTAPFSTPQSANRFQAELIVDNRAVLK